MVDNLKPWQVAMCTEGWYQKFNPQANGEPNLETFNQVAGQCAEMGYDGLEVVATTLCDSPILMTPAAREDFRRTAQAAGVPIVGLHWLLADQEGVHLTNPDSEVKQRTIETIVGLIRLTADLGGRFVVHGSPAQRTLLPGVTYAQGFDTAVEIYQKVMPQVEDLGVTVCFEQLSALETNFCTTLSETAHLIRAVSHRLFQGHLDIKALYPECNHAGEIYYSIIQWGKMAGHCHLNDPNQGRPGCGGLDFMPIFLALKSIGYHQPWKVTVKTRWLSVEVFNFQDYPIEQTAKESLAHIKKMLAAIG